MGILHMLLLLIFSSGFIYAENEYSNYIEENYPLLMQNVHPYKSELYLCTPVRVNWDANYYIVGFEPKATMKTAHHMLLYGCGESGSNENVWNCGEMSETNGNEHTASPCKIGTQSQIIYAWARDAPKLILPKGVGFKVGKDSSIKYLVLQIHYSHKLNDDELDNSGVILKYTRTTLNKLAGVLVMGTTGFIKPHSIEFMETACQINEQKTIYPFAYRTHTHNLGVLVTGYHVTTDKNGQNKWILLGKRDPLTPQMFYPANNTDPINPNDIIAARCIMKSNRDNSTFIGATNKDEMCNFYLMYYVKNDEPLNMKYCFSAGPPLYYWKNSDSNLNNVPEYEINKI